MSAVRGPVGDRRLVAAGLALAGILLIGANLRPAMTSVGPVIGEIKASASLTSVQASLLISLPVVCFAIVSPLAPRLAQRFSVRALLAFSLLALSAGIVLRSLPVPALLWVGSVILGVAIGLMNVLLPALVKSEFPDKIGAVTGSYSAVQSGVAALASGLAVPIAGDAANGWRLAIGLWAGLALLGFAAQLAQIVQLRDPVRVPTAGVVRPRSGFFWRSALAWQATFYMACASTIFYAFITWWPSVAREDGFAQGAAGLQLLALQVAAIFASLAAAALIQRSTRQSHIGAAVAGLSMLAVLGMLVAPQLALLWACTAGLGTGTGIVLALSLFGLRARDQADAASLSGMAQCVGYAIAAAGPVLLGALHDATGSWTAPLIVLLAIGAIQLPFAYLAGRPLLVSRG